MPHVCLLGIGPGDPELITVKAARIMAEADLVYVPQSNDQGRSVAETIIAPYAHTAKLRFAFVPPRDLSWPRRTRAAEGPVYRKWSGRRALQQSEGFAVE